MPTYSYKCTECGDAFDAQQAFTDDSLTVCPACGGRLRKVFNPIGVTFNGSGFYRTDSRAQDSAKRKPALAKSESKSEVKSDSKTETKSEGKKDAAAAAKPAASTSA